MRRGLLACGLALLAGSAAAAQDTDFGFKVGLNLAKLSGSGLVEQVAQNFDRQPGPVGGLFVRIPLGDVLALQPEVLYSRKGAEVGLAPLGTVGVVLDYVDLALPLRVDLPRDSDVRFFLLGGPYLGINLDAKLKVRVILSFDEDIDDRVEDTDFGLLGGAGVRFPAGSAKLDVEARYSHGLSRVNRELAGQDVKNRVITLMAGISF